MADSTLRRQSDVTIEDIRSCWKVPAIAHFCSLFRSTFSLPDFEIEELEEALFLDAGVEQSDFITSLVVQLLRGIHNRKSITSDDYLKWLRSVMKDQWELGQNRVNPLNSEDVTFKMLPTLTKVEILHALCDYRLDAADVAVLKDYDGDNLRVEPLGTDRAGATYWYFYGTRLYKEDRELTQEEKEAKRKEKLKEKRKRKAEHLKAIRKLKEARKKLKGRKGKKSSTKNAKKKKAVKNGEDGCNAELAQGCFDNVTNSSSKKTKKGPKEKKSKNDLKSSSLGKTPRSTKSKKGRSQVDTAKTSRKSNNGKCSTKTNCKGKQKGASGTTSSDNPKKRKVMEKRCKPEAGKRKSDTGADKNQSKVNKKMGVSSGKDKKEKDKMLQESPRKSRKRKVIKSKEIISDSEDDSDEDQPLTKLAKKTPKKSPPKTSKEKLDKKKSASTPKTGKARKKVDEASTDASRGKKKGQVSARKGKTDGKGIKTSSEKGEVEDVNHLSSEDEPSSSSIPQTSDTDTDSDSEDDCESPRWHLVCHSQDDWEKLTEFFKKSKVKCERELFRILCHDFLPEIHSLFAAKEKALRKKLQELAPRRASSRVVIMQLKREEEERLKSIEETEQLKIKQQLEEEKETKREQRSKRLIKDLEEETCSQMKQSTVQKNEKRPKKARKAKPPQGSLSSTLQQVYDAVQNHEDSWPFQDPVDEAYAPAYYQIIIKPMCLKMIQKKLRKKEYKMKNEFEQDMNQLFTNCLEYNGPGNEYTLMAENLKSCFDYNMDLMFPKLEPDSDDNHDDELKPDTYQRPPQRQSAKNANSRLEKLDDKVYARLRGLSSSESSFLGSRDSSRGVSEEEEDRSTVDEKFRDTNVDVKDEICDHAEIEDGDQREDSKDQQREDLGSLPGVGTCKSEDESDSTGSENDGHSEISSEVDKKSSCSSTEEESFSRRRNVIAFAPSLATEEPKERCEREDDQFELPQSNKDDSDMQPLEMPQGPNLPPHSQGLASSKINRVKPVQNVRPYKPDGHSEESRNVCESVQGNHAESSHASQGVPPMIDLNSRRLDIINAPSSSNEFHVPLSNTELSTDLKQTDSQGYLYDDFSLDPDLQHSKRTSGCRSSTTVPDSAMQQVKPVNRFLPSARTFEPGHWQPNLTQRGLQTVGQSVPHVQPPSQGSDSANKLWHPLGDGEKHPFTDNGPNRSAFRPHVVASQHERSLAIGESTQVGTAQIGTAQIGTAQIGTAQIGTAQIGTAQSRNIPSQSGNILESLLHKNQHSLDLNPAKTSTGKGVSEQAKMLNEMTSRASSSSQSVGPEFGQGRVDKMPNVYNPNQGGVNELVVPAAREMKVSVASAQGDAHSTYPAVQTLNANAFQPVARQPENTMRGVECFSGRQQNASVGLGLQCVQSEQQEYRKTAMPQLIAGQREDVRGLNSMTSASYLSMLAADSRSGKGQLALAGYSGPQAAYNQTSLPIYNDQLRMHHRQGSTPYDYPSGSPFSLFSPRPTLGGHSSSAFTLADAYSQQSSFRFQRPNQAVYPSYLSREEADAWARRHYQQQLQHRASLGPGFPPYPSQPTRTHPDMAYYTQHGVSGALMGRQDMSGTSMPYNPSFMPNQPHMGGYK